MACHVSSSPGESGDTPLRLKSRGFLGAHTTPPKLQERRPLLAGVPASKRPPLTSLTRGSRSTMLRSFGVPTFTCQTSWHNALVEVSKNGLTVRLLLSPSSLPQGPSGYASANITLEVYMSSLHSCFFRRGLI